MLFRQRLRSGKLAPEKAKGFELCMDAYRSVALIPSLTGLRMLQRSWTFNSCRIPCPEGTDWILSHANSASSHDNIGHVIVIRKNRFWKINAEIGDELVGMGDLIR